VPRTVTYELGLEERAGRWEVTTLSGAPTLEEDEAQADDPTTTTTEPASTTSESIASSPGA
jgi:hypothetical protein